LSFKKHINFILFLFIFIISFKTEARSGDSPYRWPLNVNNGYSATFQEFRKNHFHAGIDIRTFQKTGFPVYAIDNGKIFRIRCVKRGSGRGIYLKHNDGNISIYFHLKKFIPKLEKILKRYQKYKGKKYFGNYFLSKPIWVKKGSLIGYSGETGSGFPHLHLEIRNSENYAINPFKMISFPERDENKPVISGIILRSIGKTKINGVNGEIFFKAYQTGNGKYTLDKIEVDGEFESILNATDISDTGRRVAPYKISANINGNTVFDISFEKFKWAENNEIGFVYDMYYSNLSNYFFNLFSQEGYTLKKIGLNPKEIFITLKNGYNLLTVNISDNFGNRSILEVPFYKINRSTLTTGKKSQADINNSSYLTGLTDLKPEVFINRDKVSLKITDTKIFPDNIKLNIKAGEKSERINPESDNEGIYFTFSPLDYKGVTNADFSIYDKGMLSSIIRKRYKFITLRKGFPVNVKADDFSADFDSGTVLERKVMMLSEADYSSDYPLVSKIVNVYPYTFPFLDKVIFSFKNSSKDPEEIGVFKYSLRKKKWFYVNTNFNNETNVYSTRQLSGGIFALMRDIFPPDIRILRSRSEYLSGMKNLVIIINDRGKGIDDEKIILKINGRKLSDEYDPDRKWIKPEFPVQYFRKGKNTIYIYAEDRAGNKREREYSFRLK